MDDNQRRILSSQCRANPETIPNTIKNINNCLTENENNSIKRVTNNLMNFRTQIMKYKSIFDDINATGEQIFGQAASTQQLKDIEARNTALEKERDEILQKIKDYKAISEINARDFQDIKSELPEKYPVYRLNVLEDYSLAIMLSGAVFLAITFFFGYMRVNGFSFLNAGQGLFLSFIILGVILMFMYYFL